MEESNTLNVENQGYFVQGYHSNGQAAPFESDSDEARQWNDGLSLRQRHDAMGIEQLPSGLAPVLDTNGTPVMEARLESFKLPEE